MEQSGMQGSLLPCGTQQLCNRMWRVFLIGGIAAIVFDILAFINAAVTLFVLAMFFAAYVLVDGAVNIWGGITNRDKDGWWMLLLLGIIGVLVGGYALQVPPVSMLAFICVVAFFALFPGISSLYPGWRIRKEISTEWVLYLWDVLSVLFAVLIVLNPEAGGFSVVLLIGAWAIFIGVLRILFAFKARKMRDSIEGGTGQTWAAASDASLKQKARHCRARSVLPFSRRRQPV
jgi:uncharacterized membrane protein HdeD (DUF308 family)